MSVAQRKSRPAPPVRKSTAEYLAAVRYPDGRRDLFRILNATDLADARELVLLEVGDVRSLVVTQTSSR